LLKSSGLHRFEKLNGGVEPSMKPLERKVAYVFCGLRILVDLLAFVAMIIFAVGNLLWNLSLEVNLIIVIAMGAAIFLLCMDIYMIVTRDIRHIMGKEQKTEQKNGRGMP